MKSGDLLARCTELGLQFVGSGDGAAEQMFVVVELFTELRAQAAPIPFLYDPAL